MHCVKFHQHLIWVIPCQQEGPLPLLWWAPNRRGDLRAWRRARAAAHCRSKLTPINLPSRTFSEPSNQSSYAPVSVPTTLSLSPCVPFPRWKSWLEDDSLIVFLIQTTRTWTVFIQWLTSCAWQAVFIISMAWYLDSKTNTLDGQKSFKISPFLEIIGFKSVLRLSASNGLILKFSLIPISRSNSVKLIV